MNWRKYNIKDSTTYPDKDKHLIVKMNTGNIGLAVIVETGIGLFTELTNLVIL